MHGVWSPYNGPNLESLWVKFDDWELCLEELVPVNLQSRKAGCSGLRLFWICTAGSITAYHAVVDPCRGLTIMWYPRYCNAVEHLLGVGTHTQFWQLGV